MGGANQPAEAGAAIKYGWEKFKANAGEIVVALIVGFVILVVLQVIAFLIFGSLNDTTASCSGQIGDGTFRCTTDGPGLLITWLSRALLQAVFFLASAAIQLFVIRATLMIMRGERLDASKIMSLENIGPYAIAALIVAAMVFVGTVLFILPGLIVAFMTHFYGYFVVDKQMAPMDAIKASFNLIKENLGPMVIFFLLSLVVLIAGAIACGIGLIVAWPVVIIASGYMYKRLQGEPVAA